MGAAEDVERVEAGCRAQPHSLYKRRVAEPGGDAGGGSTLGTPSTFAQMGPIDSPSRSRLNRDIHFEKSPKEDTMRNGMIIIDADGHVLDQESMYRQRLPEQFRKRQSISIGDGFDRRQNGRIPYPPVTVEHYLQDADREGIDVMVLYPPGGLGYTRLREHDYSIAFARTNNDLIAERGSGNPRRRK